VIPSYYESFGMVALESLACGTPVVAADVGGMRSLISSDSLGGIVQDNSPARLAEAITRVLSAGQEGAQAIATRRSLVAGYGWSVIADKILGEYQEVLSSYPVRVSR